MKIPHYEGNSMRIRMLVPLIPLLFLGCQAPKSEWSRPSKDVDPASVLQSLGVGPGAKEKDAAEGWTTLMLAAENG
jgi:hypothetical protein